MGSVKWVMSTARENMGKMVVGMLLSVLCVGFNVISPILYAQIIDDVIEGRPDGQVDTIVCRCDCLCSSVCHLYIYIAAFCWNLLAEYGAGAA